MIHKPQRLNTSGQPIAYLLFWIVLSNSRFLSEKHQSFALRKTFRNDHVTRRTLTADIWTSGGPAKQVCMRRFVNLTYIIARVYRSSFRNNREVSTHKKGSRLVTKPRPQRLPAASVTASSAAAPSMHYFLVHYRPVHYSHTSSTALSTIPPLLILPPRSWPLMHPPPRELLKKNQCHCLYLTVGLPE